MNNEISVVVTTKDHPDELGRLLCSLQHIQSELKEILIVDAGEKFALTYMLEDFDIRIIDGAGTNRAGGKNYGIREAKGDVVAFLDDDTTVQDFWLEELKYSLGYGDVIAGYSANPDGRDMPRISCIHKGNDISFPSCNLAVKRKVFDEVGLFNESFITAEDMELLYRCVEYGYNIFFNPSMKVNHYHRSTRLGFYRQAFWNGYGRKQLNDEHPDLRKRHETGLNFKNISRLGFGFAGYVLGGWFK